MTKTYKILYLCADLLDFDGTRGDMLYFLHRVQKHGIDYEYVEHQVGQQVDVRNFDFVYAGVCPQKYEALYLSHLQKDVKGLKEYIEAGKVLLAIEQSFLFLGEKLVTPTGDIDLLGVLPLQIEQLDHYMIGNMLLATKTEQFASKLNGFLNTRYYYNIAGQAALTPLGTIELGVDLLWERGFEGVRYHNFFGTQLRGPILPRNYDLADYLIQLMVEGTELPVLNSEIEAAAKKQLTLDSEAFIASGEQKKTYHYVS